MDINEITNYFKEAYLLEQEVLKAQKIYSDFLTGIAKKHFIKSDEEFNEVYNDEYQDLCDHQLQVGEYGVIEVMVYQFIDQILTDLEKAQKLTVKERCQIVGPYYDNSDFIKECFEIYGSEYRYPTQSN